MELPLFIPPELEVYKNATDDAALFTQLSKNKGHMIQFFQYAADHETWSDDHTEFMQLALDWLTQRYFQNRLTKDDAKAIAEKIQLHLPVLEPYLPKNIVFDATGVTFHVNSLMFGANNSLMHDLILNQFRDQAKEVVVLPGMTPEVFEAIQEFVMRGYVLDLWKKNESQLIEIHRQALSWGFNDLADAAEKILARYITRDNVLDKLLEANKNRWIILRKSTCAYLNDLELGCRVAEPTHEALSFEFLEFVGSSLDIFQGLSPIITHLVFRKRLIEDFLFEDVVNRVPHLIGLDISESETYDDNLQKVPDHIEELDLSSCDWLRAEHFPLLAKAFPQLKKLSLRSNSQLNYSAWGQLALFPHLIELNISLNRQLREDDLRLIQKAVPHLQKLIK